MAFFRALADAPNEQSSEWRCTLAGLVAMRLIDEWATEQPLPDAGLRALERAINMMDVDVLERAALRLLDDALLNEATGRTGNEESQVLRLARDYAECLWVTAEWTLASDVCRTVIRHARTTSEQQIVPLVYDRLGHCLLERGRQDAALEAFETGRGVASARGDFRSDLCLRISEARVDRLRGNYVAAECVLDEVSAWATFTDLPDVAARANHDRGVLAFRRGDNVRALALYFQALREYGTHTAADRVLADIALAVLQFGFRDIARGVFVILERDSVEQIQRWGATVNLMLIAVQEDHELLFDGYRRALARVRLPVRQQAYYHLIAAQGWLKFDQRSLAHRELTRAQDVVRRYRITELDGDLSATLRSLERKRRRREATHGPLPTPPPPALGQSAIANQAAAWHRGRLSQSAGDHRAAGGT
jgi:hypothetical protein